MNNDTTICAQSGFSFISFPSSSLSPFPSSIGYFFLFFFPYDMPRHKVSSRSVGRANRTGNSRRNSGKVSSIKLQTTRRKSSQRRANERVSKRVDFSLAWWKLCVPFSRLSFLATFFSILFIFFSSQVFETALYNRHETGCIVAMLSTSESRCPNVLKGLESFPNRIVY